MQVAGLLPHADQIRHHGGKKTRPQEALPQGCALGDQRAGVADGLQIVDVVHVAGGQIHAVRQRQAGADQHLHGAAEGGAGALDRQVAYNGGLASQPAEKVLALVGPVKQDAAHDQRHQHQQRHPPPGLEPFADRHHAPRELGQLRVHILKGFEEVGDDLRHHHDQHHDHDHDQHAGVDHGAGHLALGALAAVEIKLHLAEGFLQIAGGLARRHHVHQNGGKDLGMAAHGSCKRFALFHVRLHFADRGAELFIAGLLPQHGQHGGNGNARPQDGDELTAEHRHVLCLGVAEERDLDIAVEGGLLLNV